MTSKFEETNRCKCSIDININGINYVSKKDYEILKEKLNGILKKELFQEPETTPEIMKAEPKFKVGDKVVAPLSTEDIMTVDEVKYNHSMGVYMYPVKEKSITYTETSLKPVNVCYMKPEGEVCDWKDGKCRHSKTITRHDLCGFRDKPESNNPETIKGYRRTALSSEEFLEIYPEDKVEKEVNYPPEMSCPECGLKIKKKYLNMKKGYPETIILCGCSFWKLVTEYKKISDIDKE